MSAVLSSEPSSTPLELKSATLTLMAVMLKTIDLAALADDLAQQATEMPGLFDDEPVIVDLSAVSESSDAIDFDALLALMRCYGMRPLAVRGGDEAHRAAALAAGLIEAPEGVRPLNRETPPPVIVERMVDRLVERIVEREVEVQLPPKAPLVLDKPLRSGQQVHASERDLIVTALVSFGAEVSADGNIYIYAPMRGRAHAGAGGNRDARIYCHHMEAQLLAIAGVFRTTDVALPADVAGRAALVRLDGEQLAVEPLG
jgi:septum site-determining protein MinC